jgi:predicted Zn-dependent protease
MICICLLLLGFLSFFMPCVGTPEYAQTLHHTMWATFLHYDKQYAGAQDWYASLVQNPASIHSLKGYLLFLFDRKNYTGIVEYLPDITQHFANDVDVQRITAHALAGLGQKDKADALFIQLHARFPTNPDIALETIKVLVRKEDVTQALSIAEAIVNKVPNKQSVFIFYFLQAQLHVKLGNVNRALEAVNQCIAMRPQFAQGWLLMSVLELQAGNLAQATQGYASFVHMSGTRDVQLEQHLLALTNAQHAPVTAMQQATFLTKNPSFEKAVLLYKKRHYSRALTTIGVCIQEEPNNPRYKIFKIQILIDSHKISEALTHLMGWIEQEPEQQLWFSVIHLLGNAHAPIETIINTFETIEKKLPQNLWAPMYLADLYVLEGKNDDALKHYTRAVPLTPDTKMKAELYFSIALLNYKQNNFDAVATALQDGIAQNSPHGPLFNLAAYYYATKGKDVSKAQEYIHQALAQEPDNFHYIDTQAVILYKLHDYTKAEALLDRLYAQLPTDGTVMLNLAKTKYKLGKKDEAITLVGTARTVKQHDHEEKTIARLEQKWHIP